MKRLVIVGAGISGLCAAHEAARHASEVPGRLEIVVLESAPAVGGKARSIKRDGWLVETGPNGYLDNEPEFDELLVRVGIARDKLEANQAAARRYLLHGELREVKAHPLAFTRSGIVGPGGLLRMMAEPFIARAAAEHIDTESIWDFAARLLGTEAADKLIAPMVLGVFAGDARRLSVSACFPKLAALERNHGSLIRGMLATRKKRARDQRFATGPSGKLVSFRDGLQSVPPMALSESDAFAVQCNAKVETIEAVATADDGAERSPPRYRVFVRGEPTPIEANALIAAGEPFANADVVAQIAPDVGRGVAANRHARPWRWWRSVSRRRRRRISPRASACSFPAIRGTGLSVASGTHSCFPGAARRATHWCGRCSAALWMIRSPTSMTTLWSSSYATSWRACSD